MRKHSIFCFLVAAFLLLASFSHADEKLPVPSEKEQAEVVELLKEIYGTQMTSRDANVKKELAQTLLKQAEDPANDASSRYVLLHLAATHAAEALDMDTAMEAITKMEGLYRARTSDLRLQLLSQAQRSAREVEEFATLANGYAELVMIAIREDNYDVGRQAAQQALAMAQRTRDRDFVASFRDLRGTVNEAQQVYQSVVSSFNALQANPDNPGANLAVGRYLAFMKGNWSEGLPHLAKGSDKEIAAAAQTDLGSPQEAESQVALGNAWYAIAEKESNESMKNGIILRAAEYYRKALPTLGGLAKARVEQRVQEATEIAEEGTIQVTLSIGRESAGSNRRRPAQITIAPTRPVRIVDKLTSNIEYHTNRNFAFGEIPDTLEGLSFTQTSHRSTGNIKVKATSQGIIYIAIWIGEGTPALPNPWKAEDLRIPSIFHSGEWAVYSHSLRRGEELNVPSFNRFGTVIIAEGIKME